MKKLLFLFIYIGLFSTNSAVNAQGLQCKDIPFRCELKGKVLDGWYGICISCKYNPQYFISVMNNKVVTDGSNDDPYHCSGIRQFYSCAKALKNEYVVFNDKQIIRKTPDGKKVVLTWYKGLD